VAWFSFNFKLQRTVRQERRGDDPPSIPTPADASSRRGDDVIVALIDWSVEGRGVFGPTPENLYFATGELEAIYERAIAAGARDMSPIDERPWGERSFYCLGNRLCFVDELTLFVGRGAAWS
jgi:uncharacterized glyoxalase superfamily protein PhnB